MYNFDPEVTSLEKTNPYAKLKSSQEKDKDDGTLSQTVDAGIEVINQEKKDKKRAKKKQSRFILVACLLLISGMVPMMVFNPVFAAAMGYA